jgi:hypothetical protein
MCNKTPQERLEIREFILDANLYLISSSLSLVAMMSLFLYNIIFFLFYQGTIDLILFLTSTFIYLLLWVSAVSIHKKNILLG